MTVHARTGEEAARSPAFTLGNASGNLIAWIGALVGPQRKRDRTANYRALFLRHAWQGLLLVALVAATMALVDGYAGKLGPALPAGVVSVLRVVTDLGRSGWILVPTGVLIFALAFLAAPALDRFTRSVIASLVVRLGFVFVAVGLPGLIGTTLKRLIGRVRPSAEGAFAYVPFSWRPDYASLPSGHAITAFAALVAIGLIVPRARPFLWLYAVGVALSRVVVSAHFPSDVIAGAAFGAFGAILVREWFASRGLGFCVDKAGAVRTLPAPSVARAGRAIGRANDHLLSARRKAGPADAGRTASRLDWDATAFALARLSPARGRRAVENALRRKPRPALNETAARSPPPTEGSRTAAMTNAKDFVAQPQSAPAGDAREPRVSVVVPVRNEAGNVGPLVEEIARSLGGGAGFEIVYVDDGSTDGTGEAIARLMPARPFLRQIRHAASCGQSAAIRTGVSASRAPLILTLDGDGQNDPAFLPLLLQKLAQNERVGLVAGQRVGRKATGFKKLQSRIANAVRKAVLRDGTRDTGCGLKAFRREAFLALPYFDGLHRFLPALMRRDGHEIAYLDVIDRPRLTGASNYGFWDRLWVGILDLAGVWWLIRRRARVPETVEVARHVD